MLLVMPDLIRHPRTAPLPGFRIKSGMTRGRAMVMVSDVEVL